MRFRLLASLLGIAVLAVVAFAVPLAFTERTRIRDAFDAEIRREADRLEQFVLQSRSEDLSKVRLPGNANMLAGIYNGDRVLVAGKGPAHLEVDIRDCVTVGTTRVCSEPVIDQERELGFVRVAEQNVVVRDRIRQRFLALAAGVAGVLSIAAGAAIVAARRLVRPIAALRDAAQRLGAGDFLLRVPAAGIAEMDETGRSLEVAASRIGSLVERERTFSADVSHQLRTPITSLRATLETEQLVPRSDSTIVLREALADVDRLESTVENLLALARNAPLDRQVLTFATSGPDLTKVWTKRLAANGRRLVVDVDDAARAITVWASKSAVEQILDVLMTNADLHGAGTVTVTLRVHQSASLDIRVMDEGTGITGDPDAVFRRHQSGSGGLGIGLALARTLAEAEGGRLRLERAAPHPVFCLTLPPHRFDPRSSMRADRRNFGFAGAPNE